MSLIVVRERFAKPAVKAAEVSLEGHVAIRSDTKFLAGLIGSILGMPVKVKIRHGSKVVKRVPSSDAENLIVTLKTNLYSPYRLMRSGEEIDQTRFTGKYDRMFKLPVLNGEERHGLTRKAG